ncbi:MAG: hypothetical protein AAB463_01760 [Patescibacteria group bacterium]
MNMRMTAGDEPRTISPETLVVPPTDSAESIPVLVDHIRLLVECIIFTMAPLPANVERCFQVCRLGALSVPEESLYEAVAEVIVEQLRTRGYGADIDVVKHQAVEDVDSDRYDRLMVAIVTN